MFTHVVRPHHYWVSCGPGNEIIEKVRLCVMLVKVGSIGWDIEEFEQCTRYNKMSFVFVNLYSRLENSSKLRSLRPLTPDLEQL